MPANATSGLYVADLIRDDGTFGKSQMVFVVRADNDPSAILYKFDDATWEAYNSWGGAAFTRATDLDLAVAPTR